MGQEKDFNSKELKYIDECTKIHKGKFQYLEFKCEITIESKKRYKYQVLVKCNDCGYITWQNKNSHQLGHSCAKCTGKMWHNTESFIEKSKFVHGETTWNYYEIGEVDEKTKYITLTCNICGYRFTQNKSNHLQGSKCPSCSGRLKYTRSRFICKSKYIFGEETFDYVEVPNDILNNKQKVILRCNICGKKFLKAIYSHVGAKESGCPYCAKQLNGIGKNEKNYFKPFLEVYFAGITITTQFFVMNPKEKNYFVDFSIEDKKLFIEYDERHHYGKGGILKKPDVVRQEYIKSKYPDYKFIRIKDKDFMKEIKSGRTGKELFETILDNSN